MREQTFFILTHSMKICVVKFVGYMKYTIKNIIHLFNLIENLHTLEGDVRSKLNHMAKIFPIGRTNPKGCHQFFL